MTLKTVLLIPHRTKHNTQYNISALRAHGKDSCHIYIANNVNQQTSTPHTIYIYNICCTQQLHIELHKRIIKYAREVVNNTLKIYTLEIYEILLCIFSDVGIACQDRKKI